MWCHNNNNNNNNFSYWRAGPQEHMGYVTLIPDVSLGDYLWLIDNLRSPGELRRRVDTMEKNVWQCFSRIHHRVRTQKTLDAACDALGITSDL